MKNLNFTYPLAIIVFAILLGFILNLTSGKSWEENVANMTSGSKIITYVLLFVAIFLWKNWQNFKKN